MPLVVTFTIDETGNITSEIPNGVTLSALGIMLIILGRTADALLDQMNVAAINAAKKPQLVRAASLDGVGTIAREMQ